MFDMFFPSLGLIIRILRKDIIALFEPSCGENLLFFQVLKRPFSFQFKKTQDFFFFYLPATLDYFYFNMRIDT